MSQPLPSAARRSLFVYNLFFPLVFLGLLPSFLARMLRRGNYREKFGQRLGRYSAEDCARFEEGDWIWIHSISVGETLVALKLARTWRQRDPGVKIILSATTSTGFALAREAESEWLAPVYNPVDLLPIVRRVCDVLKPSRVVLIEGEAWPNLVAECYRRGIAVALADARLSPRSESRFRRFRAWTAPIFQLLDPICVPLPDDVERWMSTGVRREQLHISGSIKFDHASANTGSREEEFRTLLDSLGVPRTAPILVAGSTFPGEEKLLAQMLPALREEFPDFFPIIVPRHIERVPDILRELAPLNLRVIRRSSLPQAGPADLLLVDTTGELRDWYTLATVVFVGKSLTATGGQNPVEPAVLAKPILFGPHMDNFRVVVQHLIKSEAAIQVSDATALQSTILELLRAPDRRAALGANASATVRAHQGSTARALDILKVRPGA